MMFNHQSLLKALCLATILPLTAMGATLPKIANAKINAHTKLPVGWLVQAQKVDKDATVAVKNAQGLSQPLVLAPQKESGIFLFSGNAIPALKGDSFTLSAQVSGKGKLQLGFCAYSATGKFLYFNRGLVKTLDSAKTVTLTAPLNITDGKDFPAANIRPGVLVQKDSKITVSAVTIAESEE